MGATDCKDRTLGGFCGDRREKQGRTCAELLATYGCPACCCGEPCDCLGEPACEVCHAQQATAWVPRGGK